MMYVIDRTMLSYTDSITIVYIVYINKYYSVSRWINI